MSYWRKEFGPSTLLKPPLVGNYEDTLSIAKYFPSVDDMIDLHKNNSSIQSIHHH